MSLINNKSVFNTVEFSAWEQRRRLIPAERFLIQKFCAKTGKTLEVGTKRSRQNLFEMKTMGFTFYGVDLVHRLLRCGKEKDKRKTISFGVQDAARLGYKDYTFDQIIYLQQVLCFIEDATSRQTAIKEAYRVLRPEGIALFSFLSFDARKKSPVYFPYLVYLSLFRALNRSERVIQDLPWLRLGGSFNWRALLDKSPYVYWYKLEEITQHWTASVSKSSPLDQRTRSTEG